MKRLAVSFVALSTLDIALTLYFVGLGVSTEINPAMVRVLELPVPWIIAYKVVIPAMLAVSLVVVNRHVSWRRLNMRNVLLLAVIGELSVCLFNLTGLVVQ